jgi:archaemetzincin
VEAVHQAGHLVGLSYCDDPRCVMFMATNPSDCDRKNVSLCNVCRNELAKLNR